MRSVADAREFKLSGGDGIWDMDRKITILRGYCSNAFSWNSDVDIGDGLASTLVNYLSFKGLGGNWQIEE